MKLCLLTEDQIKASIAIVWDNNKVLLGQALNDDQRKGKWCFPGGGIMKNETPEKAAERECKEETGIVCEAKKKFKHHKVEQYWFVVCQKISGDLIPNHEFSELKWFDPDKALQLNNLYQDCQAVLIQAKAKLA